MVLSIAPNGSWLCVAVDFINQNVQPKTKDKMKTKLQQTTDYLLLIDEETEIEGGSKWVYDNKSKSIVKRIGNTFEAIEGLKQKDFVKIIGYRIISKYLYTPELDLPELPPFEENFTKLNKLIKEEQDFWYNKTGSKTATEIVESCISIGYKAAQQSNKQFSLEDMKKAFNAARETSGMNARNQVGKKYKTFNDFIQSLSTQQLPKEFILGEGNTIEEQVKNGHYVY